MISNKCNNNDTNILNRYEHKNYIMRAELQGIMPLDLVTIVISYCTFEFEKTNINLKICHKQTDSVSFEDRFRCSTKLKNDHIAIGLSSGIIYLWDPETGKIVKKLQMLKKYFDSEKKYNYAVVKMCQVCEDYIAILYMTCYYLISGNPMNICILSLHDDNIFHIDNGDFYHEDFVSMDVFFPNKLVTVTSRNRIQIWDIENHQDNKSPQINCIFNQTHHQFDKISSAFVNNNNKLIVAGFTHGDNDNYRKGTSKGTHNISFTDISTGDYINSLNFSSDSYQSPVKFENYLIVTSKAKSSEFVEIINCDTAKNLGKIDDCINVHEATYLNHDIVLIKTIDYKKKDHNRFNILLLHLPSNHIIQSITTGTHINYISDYKNGFVIVTPDEICTYKCI